MKLQYPVHPVVIAAMDSSETLKLISASTRRVVQERQHLESAREMSFGQVVASDATKRVIS
jgi:hypothetical protein